MESITFEHLLLSFSECVC